MTLRQARLAEPATIAAGSPIVEVAKLLRDKKLRHAYVIDENEFPIGIVSITDINGKVVAEGKSPQGMTARDIMSAPLHMSEIDDEVSKAYAEMVAHDTLALPIIDNGLLVGVLPMSEALRLIVEERRATQSREPEE